MTRTRHVPDRSALDRVVDGYARDGYTVVREDGGEALVRQRDHGSLLAHLALFFTVGWLTFGLLNLGYALYRRRTQTDAVRVVVTGDRDAADLLAAETGRPREEFTAEGYDYALPDETAEGDA